MAFKWSDGMTVTYTTWADRQPDDLGQIGQDCVMMKLTVIKISTCNAWIR